MRVNYFDLGTCRGTELSHFLYGVVPDLGIKEYRIYGFEAHAGYADKLKKTYKDVDEVRIINKAVASSPGPIKLYLADNGVGHSIYPTKINVGKKSKSVEGIRFSDWFNNNVEYNREDVNVLRVNIEGAELPLFIDLIENGIHKKIDLFCGAGHDVHKIPELEPKVKEYYKLLKDNNIILHRYTEHKPKKNVDMREKMKEIITQKRAEVASYAAWELYRGKNDLA